MIEAEEAKAVSLADRVEEIIEQVALYHGKSHNQMGLRRFIALQIQDAQREAVENTTAEIERKAKLSAWDEAMAMCGYELHCFAESLRGEHRDKYDETAYAKAKAVDDAALRVRERAREFTMPLARLPLGKTG